MSRIVRLMLLASFVFSMLLITQCSNGEVPKRVGLPQKWESIFFEDINTATQTSGNVPLRKKPLPAGDVEIRIWRSSMSPFEGVIFERSQNVWSAAHLISDDIARPTQTNIKVLPEPKGGWLALWERLSVLGLLELPGAQGDECVP